LAESVGVKRAVMVTLPAFTIVTAESEIVAIKVLEEL